MSWGCVAVRWADRWLSTQTAGSQGFRAAAGCVDLNSDGPRGHQAVLPHAPTTACSWGPPAHGPGPLAEEETHPVDLSSLSSKLLPGFTTLGFREERRSRGKTSLPPTPPSSCPVRPSSGSDHTRWGPRRGML